MLKRKEWGHILNKFKYIKSKKFRKK